MMRSKMVAIAVASTMLTACTEPSGKPGRGIENGGALSKTDIGTAAGVIGGGVIGSTIGGGVGQVAATIGGALLGGVLGSSVGKSLDNANITSYDQASQSAMETGRTKRWKNSDSGNYGSIQPHTRYTNVDGEYCREYSQTISVEGQIHRGHGTACRDEDGSWQIAE